MLIRPLIFAARILDDDYPKDPNPENWRTINGARVHVDGEGNADGGAGGKLNGNKFGEDWRVGQRSALLQAASIFANKQEEAKKPKPKRKNLQEHLVDYIKHQLNFDVSEFRDTKYESRGTINLDWKRMPRNIKAQITNLALRYKKFDILDNGGLGVTLKPYKQNREPVVSTALF